MTIIAPMIAVYARQELATLDGCGSILARLREDVEANAKSSADSGTLAVWANVLRVVGQSLDRAAGNIRGAIECDDEAGAQPAAEARP